VTDDTEPRGGFLIPDWMRESILAVAGTAQPVEPRERVESLEAVKANCYLSVSPELLEDMGGMLAGWEKFAFGPRTPEERAEMEARRAEREAERVRQRAAAVNEWEQLRQQYADSPAVLVVLDIHQPTDDGSLECQHPVSGYEADPEDWPCSTYEAIRNAVVA
jgi:hypothetical protein